MASSRTYLDGSSCCFNFFCLPVIPYRWLVRSAYNIGDLNSCAEDCVLGVCCTCCVVNQLYQTTATYGNPTTDGGKPFNRFAMNSRDNGNAFFRCLCACCCIPCSMGKVMSQSVGMPYCMAFCCMNPCNVRNIARYQYRLAGDDFLDECFWPSLTIYCGSLAAMFIPCIWCPIFAAFVALNMQIQLEAETRGSGENKRYLSGYAPPNQFVTTEGVQVVAPNGVSPVVAAVVVTSTGEKPIYVPATNSPYLQPTQQQTPTSPFHPQQQQPQQSPQHVFVSGTSSPPPPPHATTGAGSEAEYYPQAQPVQAYPVNSNSKH